MEAIESRANSEAAQCVVVSQDPVCEFILQVCMHVQDIYSLQRNGVPELLVASGVKI